MKPKRILIEALAPWSYWAALGYYRWATSRRWGRVHGLHPDSARVGRRIYEYQQLLRKRKVVAP